LHANALQDGLAAFSNLKVKNAKRNDRSKIEK
jgi:hypothetical protein